MSTIVTRAGKGSPLTHNEVDANFTNLNTDKYEAGDNPTFSGVFVSDNDAAIIIEDANNGVAGTSYTPALIFGANGDVVGNIGYTGGNLNITTENFNSSAIRLVTGSGEAMRVTSAGNVGIGTSSPSALLELDAGSSSGTHFQITTNGTGHNFFMTDGGGTARIRNADGVLRIDADLNNEAADSRIQFEVDGAEKMRITSAGNVGIGTTNPSELLHLASSDPRINIEDTDAGGIFQIRNTSGVAYISTLGTHAMLFATDGTERMRIVGSTGNVGIGTTSPSTELDVAGNATVGTDTGGILNVKGGSTTSPQVRFFDGGTGRARIGVPTGQTYLSLSGSDTLTADVVIDSSGNVGINELAPAEKLDVAGNIRVSGSSPYLNLTKADGTSIATIEADGTSGSELLRISSDITDVIDMTGMRIRNSGVRTFLASISNNTDVANIDLIWADLNIDPTLYQELIVECHNMGLSAASDVEMRFYFNGTLYTAADYRWTAQRSLTNSGSAITSTNQGVWDDNWGRVASPNDSTSHWSYYEIHIPNPGKNAYSQYATTAYQGYWSLSRSVDTSSRVAAHDYTGFVNDAASRDVCTGIRLDQTATANFRNTDIKIYGIVR